MQDNILFPESVVIRTKLFDVHQDREIPITGFFIVECIRPIKSIDEFTDEESMEFIKLITKLRRGMKDVLNIDVVYIFQNEDSSHSFHLWLFPRHSWMDKFGRKIESVRPIMLYAKDNLTDNKNRSDVLDAVDKMNKYMKTK